MKILTKEAVINAKWTLDYFTLLFNKSKGSMIIDMQKVCCFQPREFLFINVHTLFELFSLRVTDTHAAKL